MASAALLSLSHTLDQIPHPVHHITSLKENVNRLLLILEDFSLKSSLSISDFEAQIRDASYEAEDIIEPHISTQVFSKSISCGVISCFSEMILVLRYRDLFQVLDGVMDKFDSILGALSKMKDGKVEDLQPRNTPTAGSSRVVDSEECNPVGLDEDLSQITDRLIGLPSKLDIISIVGMGGIGKTTLARNLYNDPHIERHFDIRAWIVVSQHYHVQEMLTGLLDSTKHVGGDLSKKSIQLLSELLYKSLKGRRYLIVMDDVWDTEAWDEVRRYFPDDNNGSRIILTTRLSDVATYANSYIHHMNLLNPEASWELLHEKVFGKEDCPFILEIIGKKIAQNCEGLPLAIIVLGGLLSKGSRTQNYWEYIAYNVNSAVTGNNDDQFKKILSLSYNSLPHHLKACFLHVGVFPEDHEIFVSQLIKIWMAEGFINLQPLIPQSLEDVAEDYLKDLIDRSLIMVRKRNHDGGIKTCIIHDMLRELCLRKAQDEKFLQIITSDLGDFPSNILGKRRVSIHSNILDRLTDVHDMSIHSVLYYCKDDSNTRLLSFTVSFRLLRVLDALRIIFYEFPIEIVELVHLRYLAFIYRGKTKFPASISKLQNLQTLIVYRGELSPFIDTLYLPSTIWEMPQLRHLLFDRSFLPYPYLAQTLGKDCVGLKNLQTLTGVKNFRCTKKFFETFIPNLKKLGISYFHDKHNEWSAYEFNSFVHLDQLETLKCIFFLEHEKPLSINLAFPRNLKKLTLSGCRISWEQMTVIGSLQNLEVLKLKNRAFEGSKWEPTVGQFKKLKFLLIYKSLLEHWGANAAHLPLLKSLILVYCPKLVEIPLDIGNIPTLDIIELCQCSPSAVESAMEIQEDQQDNGNDTLRVRVSSIRDYNFSRLNTSLRKAEGAAWFG